MLMFIQWLVEAQKWRLLLYKVQKEYWSALKSFLLYLNILKEEELRDIDKDELVFETLRKL